MRTVISHFYNEEYLLPWWLNHHKKYFDHGIMINYASTDDSVNIIKKICPTWEIVNSVNEQFDAYQVNQEVEVYERKVSGWKIALNTTEFLVGNFNLLDSGANKIFMMQFDTSESTSESKKYFYIPTFYFVEKDGKSYPNLSTPLYDQLFYGVDYEDYPALRSLRCMHNENVHYPAGRHYTNYQDTTDQFIIFNYGFAPMNEHMVKRKLQIQHKIPLSDKQTGSGVEHHNWGKGLTEEVLLEMCQEHREKSKDLSNKMKKYINLLP